MMLLSLHIVAIALLVAMSGGMAYQMGKQEGIRITRSYYETQKTTNPVSPPLSPPPVIATPS